MQALVKYKNSCDTEDDSTDSMKVIESLDSTINILKEDIYYRTEHY